MIKLFSLKQQKKDGEATPKAGNQKKASAAQLRITKGIKTFHLMHLFTCPQLLLQLYLAQTNESVLGMKYSLGVTPVLWRT